MIEQLEENDSRFTSLWSNSIKLACGIVYENPRLQDDQFFNKLANVTCISQSMIDEAITHFNKNNTRPFVYSLNNKELENFLQQQGFSKHDTLHVLIKKSQVQNCNKVRKISDDEIPLWSEIFCESFYCHEWKSEIISILQRTILHADYYVDDSNSGCTVLYQSDGILGLYCLGTIPSARKKGIASSIVEFACAEAASRNLQFLMLETYGRDNLRKFYSELGFEEVYSKEVFTI